MQSRIFKAINWVIALCLVVFTIAPSVQGAPACDTGGAGKPYICVNKGGIAPVEGVHFTFDLTDPDNPGVTFKTGSDSWKVWSQVSDTDTSPAVLGDLELDPSVSSDDFEIMIYNDDASGPGATNLGGAVLKDAGWSGYSALAAGSIITGNVTGDIEVVKDGSGNGGEIAR